MATFVELYARYKGRDLHKFREKLCRRLHVTGSTITNWAKGVYEPNSINKSGLSIILNRPIEELFPSTDIWKDTKTPKQVCDSEFSEELVKKYMCALTHTAIDVVDHCTEYDVLIVFANNIAEQIENINEGKAIVDGDAAEKFIENLKRNIRPGNVQLPRQKTASECMIVGRCDDTFIEVINQVLPIFIDVVALNKILHSVIKRIIDLK